MKILLLDLETAPNLVHVWGLWQQNVGLPQILTSGYTLCWAAKWHGEKKVMFDSIHQSSSEKMLFGLHDLLGTADAVVHYNGTKFDIPTIQKEFVLNHMAPPAPYKQIDLLQVARKEFRFPSNKLDYVVQALGVGKKIRHAGHELWIACMNGDDKAWKEMENYNKNDVIILEKLYDRLLPWIKTHPNYGLYNGGKVVCVNCGGHHLQRRGFAFTNAL